MSADVARCLTHAVAVGLGDFVHLSAGLGEAEVLGVLWDGQIVARHLHTDQCFVLIGVDYRSED